MSPCILSKKTGDSNMILLNDGLTINLPFSCFVSPLFRFWRGNGSFLLKGLEG